MATKIQYLTFYIVLTDAELVAQYQTQYPEGVNRAPYNAATAGGAAIEFGAPWRGYTAPAASEAPFSWSPWYSGVTPGGPFPIDVATFSRHTGGFFGIGGTTTKYYWMGQFVAAAPDVPTIDGVAVPVTVPIAQRWFIEGFESPGNLGGVSSGLLTNRQASRHVGGLGLAMRGGTAFKIFTLSTYGVSSKTKGWSRFRLRWRKAGTNLVGFWRLEALLTSSNGCALSITPTGQIAVEELKTGTRALLGTVYDCVLNTWVLVDVLFEMNPAAAGAYGRVRVYVNHDLVGDFTSIANPGMGEAGANVGAIEIGNVFAVGDDTELDIDDLMAADMPLLGAVEDLRGVDFLNASKIALVRAKGFAATHGTWVGDFRRLWQKIQDTSALMFNQQTLTSSTASAILAVTTDADRVVDEDTAALGVVAMRVDLQSTRGASSGTLGYSIAGAAAVNAAIVQQTTIGPNFVQYRPSALAAPVDITPLELYHAKGAAADAATVVQLTAQVEMIGTFGAEDFRATEAGAEDPPDFPGDMGQHNAPYPRTPWALDATAAPISPYIVQAGTYVGNGTGQDLSFRAPVHLFFVRPTTGDTGGGHWWSTMLGAHGKMQQGTEEHFVVGAQEDRTFVPSAGDDVQTQSFLIRIAGSNSQSNAVGVTYQYVAVMDPGMRFMLNTAIAHRGAMASATNPLINPSFTPQFAFFWSESFDTTTTVQMGVKSAGHAAASVNLLGSAALANAMTFAAGSITTQAALHGLLSAHKAMPLMLWRAADGNADPGQAKVVSFGSYVGDGAASRSLMLGTGGVRPLYAIIIPEGGTAVMRDPSHTTTTSSQMVGGTSVAATGISAGALDGLTVGSTLNSNGVVHHYFVLWGSATAGNGGWSINGEYIPVEANSPADGPWPLDPSEPVAEVETPDTPELPDDMTTDLTTACVPYTTKIANMALSRIGISKPISNLATEQSEAAELVRLHYANVVGRVLRDYAWPFATRYADLALVAGTDAVAVNKDWQYSYRAPANMAFLRRIVGQAYQGRGADPDPIRFRYGADDTGGLVYTDEPIPTAGTLVAEYTKRMDCPASSGTPDFRSCVAWLLASELAAPLSRAEKVDGCLQKYAYELDIASTDAANEAQPAQPGEAPWITGRN